MEAEMTVGQNRFRFMTDPAQIAQRVKMTRGENDNHDANDASVHRDLTEQEIEILFLKAQAELKAEIREAIDWTLRELSGEGFRHRVSFAGTYIDLLARLYNDTERNELREILLALRAFLRPPADRRLSYATPSAYDPNLYEYTCATYDRWCRVLDSAVAKLVQDFPFVSDRRDPATPLQRLVGDLRWRLKFLASQACLLRMALIEQQLRYQRDEERRLSAATAPVPCPSASQTMARIRSEPSPWPDQHPFARVVKARKS